MFAVVFHQPLSRVHNTAMAAGLLCRITRLDFSLVSQFSSPLPFRRVVSRVSTNRSLALTRFDSFPSSALYPLSSVLCHWLRGPQTRISPRTKLSNSHTRIVFRPPYFLASRPFVPTFFFLLQKIYCSLLSIPCSHNIESFISSGSTLHHSHIDYQFFRVLF